MPSLGLYRTTARWLAAALRFGLLSLHPAGTGEISLQRPSIVMLRIMRAIDESNPAVPRGITNRLQCFRLGIELGEIPALELLPLLRVMGKPAAQLVAGQLRLSTNRRYAAPFF